MTTVFKDVNMHLHELRLEEDSTPVSGSLSLFWSAETGRLAVVDDGGKALFQRLWTEHPAASGDEPLPHPVQMEVSAWWKDAADHKIWFPPPLSDVVQRTNDRYAAYLDAGGELRLEMTSRLTSPKH